MRIVVLQKTTVDSRHFSVHASDITICTQFTSADLCIAKRRNDAHRFNPLISASFQHQFFSELFPSATAALSDCHGFVFVELFLFLSLFSETHCFMPFLFLLCSLVIGIKTKMYLAKLVTFILPFHFLKRQLLLT